MVEGLISIIIPTKLETGDPLCLRSINNQTYSDYEIIIIRDVKQRGASWARNEGRKKAKGEYLFFCDDDIELNEKIFEIFISKLKKSDASFAYCDYERRGSLTGIVKGVVWNPSILKETNYISTMSLIKAKDFPKEGFDESLQRFQDWDLWLTMMEQGKYGMYFSRVLFIANYNKKGISCNPATLQSSINIVKEKHRLRKGNLATKIMGKARKLSSEAFRKGESTLSAQKPEKALTGANISRNKANKVEIVVIKYNLPEAEEKCINNVRKFTTFPYKLTVLDNYEKNESLSSIWNRMIKNSDCKYVCLLNNDAFVTPNWLTEMMSGFIDEKVAAVGPSGDHVGGKQREIGTIELAKQHKGKYTEIDLLSGFCMLVRTGLNIEFPLEVPFYGGEHAWEVIAKRKGYKFIWSQGAFVYHLGEACGKKEGNLSILRKEGQLQYVNWLTKTTPVLFTVHNRLCYTKKSLEALINSITGKIIIIDNNSEDKNKKYLEKMKRKYPDRIDLYLEKENKGISGAMNKFFELTEGEEYVAKVDNDTVVPKNWLRDMLMMATYRVIDILQAKHHILNTTYATFDEWMNHLKPDERNDHIFYSPFVGGSGVVIKRDKIKNALPNTDWILGGWGTFQEQHKNLRKAFCDNVEVELLDMKGDNEPRYDDYINYYVKTKRTKIRSLGVDKTLAEITRRFGKRFAYTRFGDGELQMMEDFKGHQFTQWVTPKFKKELIESFKIDHDDYLIGNIANMAIEEKAEEGMFMTFPNNNELVKITQKYYKDKTFYSPIAFHYAYIFEEKLFNLVIDLLKKHRVAFVGGEHLKSIKRKLGITDFVVTPSEQAYDTIDKWYPNVEVVAERNDIILFALSMTANIVQKRLWKSNFNIGTIDFGSLANALVNKNLANHTWIAKANKIKKL